MLFVTFLFIIEFCFKRVLLNKEVHLTFDRYSRPSIKDQERNRRSTRTESFVISGPEQVQSENGKDLVKNQSFKDQFSMFVMTEWKKN